MITLDTLDTNRRIAKLIRDQQGYYLLIVKRNQALLYEYLGLLFAAHPSSRPGG